MQNRDLSLKQALLLLFGSIAVVCTLFVLSFIYHPWSNNDAVQESETSGLTEQAGLTEDPDYWSIDGPTRGNEPTNYYPFRFINGGDLATEGLYVHALRLLLPEWEKFVQDHDELRYARDLTYIAGSFHDYVNTQVFQLHTDLDEEKTITATYNKTTQLLEYSY